MHRRDVLKSAASIAALGSAALGRPAIAQGATKTLRFVPQANLSSLDPIWTTAGTATNHGHMVFDTLYGIDDRLQSQPQMCAGHEVSSSTRNLKAIIYLLAGKLDLRLPDVSTHPQQRGTQWIEV